jgi:hypothetical protein
MKLTVQWTVGDVSSRGFETLALSIFGAQTVFGAAARYVVCVNTLDLETARERVGPVARLAEWHDSSHDLPDWILPYLDARMAEGVAWKFAPLRRLPDTCTLSLDNDVVLWNMPDSIRRWLDDGDSLLIAEDVKACFGQFAPWCPPVPRNSGVRGYPPRFDAEARFHALLRSAGKKLCSETDEQGLAVALACSEKHVVVPLREVSVSGYFRPHLLELGTCGAHFVGINCKGGRGVWDGRPIEEFIHHYWDGKRAAVRRNLGLPARLDFAGGCE